MGGCWSRYLPPSLILPINSPDYYPPIINTPKVGTSTPPPVLVCPIQVSGLGVMHHDLQQDAGVVISFICPPLVDVTNPIDIFISVHDTRSWYNLMWVYCQSNISMFSIDEIFNFHHIHRQQEGRIRVVLGTDHRRVLYDISGLEQYYEAESGTNVDVPQYHRRGFHK